jgi:hypothetical protein
MCWKGTVQQAKIIKTSYIKCSPVSNEAKGGTITLATRQVQIPPASCPEVALRCLSSEWWELYLNLPTPSVHRIINFADVWSHHGLRDISIIEYPNYNCFYFILAKDKFYLYNKCAAVFPFKHVLKQIKVNWCPYKKQLIQKPSRSNFQCIAKFISDNHVQSTV